jgi:hypothetical protein
MMKPRGIMASEGRFRRLKGAIGNAFVFAAGWSITFFIVWLLLRQARFVPDLSILDGIGMSIRVGFMGFITGAVFPIFMRYVYRGRRLSEISAGKFALVAGIITGLFVPTLMQATNILSGDGMVAFALIRMDIVMVAAFGALAAGVSLKLAQYADRLFPDTFQYHLNRLEEQTRLTAGEADIPAAQRPANSRERLRNDRQ